MIELVIRKEDAGGRADKYICRYLDKAPKSFVYKMLRKKNIVLNGKKAAGNELLQEGDVIGIYFSDETLSKFHSQLNALDQQTMPGQFSLQEFSDLILYEDEHIIALNKPCGILSQKADKEDFSINEMLVSYLLSYGEMQDAFKPGISNRLDRNTSGIILAGKDPASSRALNQAIKTKGLSKKYLTVIKGVLKEEKQIDGWLLKDRARNKVQIFSDAEPEQSGNKAERIRTAYRPLCANERFTLLEVDLITGKSHQIRAHLASQGHPVIGDAKYGCRETNRYVKQKYGLDAQFLHAHTIEFIQMEDILSYLNGKTIKAGLPECFRTILKGEKLWLPGEAED